MMQFKFPNVLLLHSTSILTFLCTRTIVKKNIHAAVTTLRKRVGKKWKRKKNQGNSNGVRKSEIRSEGGKNERKKGMKAGGVEVAA